MHQNTGMSQDNNNERSASYSNFRIALDIGMGVLYIVLGIGMAYTKRFASIELGNGVAYAMCGLLFLYGGFRIYRGIVDLKSR